MSALSQQSNVPGEYYLNGIPETASGFKLNADGTFGFFFSYGALDRYGKGHYRIMNDSVSFTSDSVFTHDFTLVNSKKQPGSSTTIKISDPNENILRYVFIRVKSGTDVREDFADSEGYFKYDGNRPDSIELGFEFCPEKITLFPVSTQDNYFEFKFEPWLFEYFFRDFRLKLSDSRLTGGHPLLQGTQFSYSK
jgi:hypothetical protein